jgi:hypothetical protein
MTGIRSATFVRAAGLLVGLGLAALAVLSWRVPAQGTPLGADLAFVAAPSGELDLSPGGRFLSARSLSPGAHPASGELRVRNQTGGALALRPRALPSTRELDRLVMVDLSVGPRRLYRGRLGGLRGDSRHRFRLASGAAATLSAQVWIPSDAGPGWRGRIADVQLELRGGGERGR